MSLYSTVILYGRVYVAQNLPNAFVEGCENVANECEGPSNVCEGPSNVCECVQLSVQACDITVKYSQLLNMLVLGSGSTNHSTFVILYKKDGSSSHQPLNHFGARCAFHIQRLSSL